MTYDPSSGTTGTSTTSEKAEQVATSAKEQGRNAAAVASDELHTVAAEVSTQARDLVGELRTQVGEQTSTQKQRLSEVLRTFTDELQQMADSGGGSGVATELVRQIASRAQGLQQQIEQGEPADLLNSGRHYARQRPGAFLLGALAAGVLAGRITRGSKSQIGSSSTPSRPQVGTAASMPLATPPIDRTTGAGYGETSTFEPSGYESGYAAPTAPGTRPYSGGGQL